MGTRLVYEVYPPLFSAFSQTHGPFLAQATPGTGRLRALIPGLCRSWACLFTAIARFGQAEALSRRRTLPFLGTLELSASRKNDTRGHPEAILKRFTRHNLQHPTYKALSELG